MQAFAFRWMMMTCAKIGESYYVWSITDRVWREAHYQSMIRYRFLRACGECRVYKIQIRGAIEV